MDKEEVLIKGNTILTLLKQKKQVILCALMKTETYKTAISEYQKSIYCLENLDKQIEYIVAKKYKSLCVYMPQNQPLYSMVLFAIIPGFMFEEVYFRPPTLLTEVYANISSLLNISNIICVSEKRGEFFDCYVKHANVIIYTGNMKCYRSDEKLPKI